jgi:tetratricopeptide (TPR) repeat protein
LAHLRQFIAENYDRSDLRTLCSNLGVDRDEPGADGLSAESRERLLWMECRERLDKLLNDLHQILPKTYDQAELSMTLAGFEAGADVNNLGLVLMDLGNREGARTAFEHAVEIDEAVYGPYHPHVARDVNNLGNVLKEMGDLEGARDAYERALVIIETTLGPEHPNVAALINNLGVVLKDLGDLEGARAAFECAFAVFKRYLPPEHPHLVAVGSNVKSLRPQA